MEEKPENKPLRIENFRRIMTTKQIPTEKRAIGKQIEECILKAASHFRYMRPTDIYVAFQLKSPNAQKTRTAVWQRMIDCGYTRAQIGRLFKKEPDYVCKQIRRYVPQFMKRDLEMIRHLPFVDGGKEAQP